VTAALRHRVVSGFTPTRLAVLVLCVLAAQALWLTPTELSRLFPDDAYFYMKTAHNIGAGLGSTFDGINATNGYHPLYMGVLVLASKIAPLEGWAGLYTVLGVDLPLTAAWIWIAGRTAQLAGWSSGATCLLLAALLPLAFNDDLGTEVNLLLPLAWGYAWLAQRVALSESASRLTLGAGWLGAAIVLTRVDALLFVAVVTSAVLVARAFAHGPNPREALRVGALLAGPAFVALTLFGALNYAWTGHWSPVSAWLKAESLQDLHYAGIEPRRGVFLLVAAAGACLAILRGARTRSAATIVSAGLGVWVLAYLALLCFGVRGGPESWYFPLPLSIGTLVGLDALRAPFERANPVLRGAAVVLALAAAFVLSAAEVRAWLSRGRRHDAGIEIAEWIKRELPLDAHIFQVDNSGIVGYFSERAVINGDGLINGWEYQDSLRAGRLPDYLARHDVEWFVLDELPTSLDDVQVPIPLWTDAPVVLDFTTPPDEVARCGRFVLLHAEPESTVTHP
jgi:hypothetical protein